MAYTIQCSQTLSPEGAAVRIKVFVEEQGFQNEFDRWDENGCAWHVLVQDGETPIAAGGCARAEEVCPRTHRRDSRSIVGSTSGSCWFPHWTSEAYAGIPLSLSAGASDRFYQKLGYALTEDYHMDEFCPHVICIKSLKA